MRRIWNAPQAAFHRIEAGIDRHVHARQHVDEVRRTALRLAAIKPAHVLGHDVAIEEDRRILAHRGEHRRKPAADDEANRIGGKMVLERSVEFEAPAALDKIGRASCWESMCLYV